MLGVEILFVYVIIGTYIQAIDLCSLGRIKPYLVVLILTNSAFSINDIDILNIMYHMRTEDHS